MKPRRGEITNMDVRRARVLLERILGDFDPERFTLAELKSESLEGSHATVGGLVIDYPHTLAVLLELGLIEERGKCVYRVTQAGRMFDDTSDTDDEAA